MNYLSKLKKSFLLFLLSGVALAAPDASRIQFEPGRNPDYNGGLSDLTANDTQSAVEEVNNKVANLASPGYVFTKGGNVKNAWLLVGSVPSNITGINFGFFNGQLSSITVSNEAPNTFQVEFYEHDGTTYTLLTTVSLVAVRSKEFTEADFGTVNVTKGKELGVKINDTGSAKDIIVTVQINGTLTP